MRAFALVLAFCAVGCVKRVPMAYDKPPPLRIGPEVPVGFQGQADGQSGANNFWNVAGSLQSGAVLNKFSAIPIVEKEFADAWRVAKHTVAGANPTLMCFVEPKAWRLETTGSGKNQVVKGRLEVKVTVRAYDGSEVFSASYVGWGNLGYGEPYAMGEAAQRAANQFTAELYPRRVEAEFKMDTSDPRCELAAQLVDDQRYEEAYSELVAQSDKGPESPPVLYNRALLAARRKSYQEAAQLLDRALQLWSDDDYRAARNFVAQAIRAEQVWSSMQPPPAR